MEVVTAVDRVGQVVWLGRDDKPLYLARLPRVNPMAAATGAFVAESLGSAWWVSANLARTREPAHETTESGPPAETLDLLWVIQKFLWPKRSRS